MIKLKLCGLSQSMVLAALSAWGIIQLSIMGGLYYVKSVNLYEDLPHFEEEEETGITSEHTDFYNFVDREYKEV